MNEKRIQVRPFLVKLMCSEPRCQGEMKPTGRQAGLYATLNEHRCDTCGSTEMVVNKTYPYVEYQE